MPGLVTPVGGTRPAPQLLPGRHPDSHMCVDVTQDPRPPGIPIPLLCTQHREQVKVVSSSQTAPCWERLNYQLINCSAVRERP